MPLYSLAKVDGFCFFRKILNDLSCVELDLQPESDSGGESSEESSVSNSAMTGSQAGMPSSTLSSADAISYVACKYGWLSLYLACMQREAAWVSCGRLGWVQRGRGFRSPTTQIWYLS